MKLVRQFEQRLDGLLDELAGRVFSGPLHPTELAMRLIRTADLSLTDGLVAHNQFRMVIPDSGQGEVPHGLVIGLERLIDEAALERGWRLDGPVRVTLSIDPDLRKGAVYMTSDFAPGPRSAWAELSNQHERIPITVNRAVIGREIGCDVVVRARSDQPDALPGLGIERTALDRGPRLVERHLGRGTESRRRPGRVRTGGNREAGGPELPDRAARLMPDLLLTLLRLIFLGLVYLFVWQIARSIATHLGIGSNRSSRRSGTRVAIVKSDAQSGLTFTVTDSMVLGRSDEADFLLDDPYASDFHLRLTTREGRLVVSDLGSTNGTYVNGRRVTTPIDLNRGDAVQVGKTVMEVR